MRGTRILPAAALPRPGAWRKSCAAGSRRSRWIERSALDGMLAAYPLKRIARRSARSTQLFRIQSYGGARDADAGEAKAGGARGPGPDGRQAEDQGADA